MRRQWLSWCFGTAALLLAASAARPEPAAQIHVIDGDTVEQAGVRWQLAGIDAPEIHRARCPEERRRGVLGAARLITLIETHGARLDPIQNGRSRILRDKFGRTLGTLTLGDGRAWAEVAVGEGHAVVWDGKGRQPDWCGSPVM